MYDSVSEGAAPVNDASSAHETVRVAVVGHVDHGKSTLVGRLLHDTGSLTEGKAAALEGLSKKRGMELEWAFLTDALQAERDQGITIDVAQAILQRPGRRIVLLDAPGHREFLKNMITGAAQADAAILVVDAAEGVRDQTRRHATLLSLLGVKQVAVFVNKIDLIGYDQALFETLEGEIRALLQGLGVVAKTIAPVSARHGDNIADGSDNLGWWAGPSVLEALDSFQSAKPAHHRPARLLVQDVYKFDERRIIAGRLVSGRLNVGDALVFAPSGVSATIKSFERWNAPSVDHAIAGESIGIQLDEQIFVKRGDVGGLISTAPVASQKLRVRVFWLGDEALSVGKRLKIKVGSGEAQGVVEKIERAYDTAGLEARNGLSIPRHDAGDVVLALASPIAADAHDVEPAIGRVVLVDGFTIAGGGVILEALRTKVELPVPTARLRATRFGHRGAVVWLTGLSGAGKSTVAEAAEKRLFASGINVVRLDGDVLRAGLNKDLGFSAEDRAEALRRTTAVAKILMESGLVVLVPMIAPYAADRASARATVGDGFHEVYVSADVATCESRDPKGLYAKARAGNLPGFTGISAPYEAPTHPELTIDTTTYDQNAAADQLTTYIVNQVTGAMSDGAGI